MGEVSTAVQKIEFVSAEEWSAGDLEAVARLYTESFAEYVCGAGLLD